MRRTAQKTAFEDETLSKGERTRAKLIAAAIDAFHDKGFHNTKISEIVDAAGYTQPTFYLHYRSKEAIYQYLVERVHAELREVIEGARIPAMTSDEHVRDKLKAAIKAFLQYFVENPKLASIGYYDVDHNLGLREEIVDLVTQNLSFEQGAGYCRQTLDPAFISHCYNGSLERVIRVYLLSGRYDANELAEKLADLYGYGTIPEKIRQVGKKSS